MSTLNRDGMETTLCHGGIDMSSRNTGKVRREMTDAEFDIYMRGMCRGIIYGALAVAILTISGDVFWAIVRQ